MQLGYSSRALQEKDLRLQSKLARTLSGREGVRDERPMMQGSAAMDRPIEKSRWSRPRLLLLALAVALVAGLLFSYPAVRRWQMAETSVSMERIRVATVVRGDLVRDVSAQGNIVAAFSPTLTSPARGTARVDVNPGEVVERGRVADIARVVEKQHRESGEIAR